VRACVRACVCVCKVKVKVRLPFQYNVLSPEQNLILSGKADVIPVLNTAP
jgi:hypothetical protein